ncbi:hypothetical protein NUW58_g4361 [Xylaria curta]|uniref:Uncharacterized protein n=1 Tax=Xylaria curta TaxID=42375 RepID=A0ACC1P9E3_9PEZI|nr:hypothetical protein NUW58_g4361 [Xylaria curta]
MTTHSNSGASGGDLEIENVGERLQRDTSSSTRFVRDVTYKMIPFCSFLLVVFSVGAIFVSTFGFNKPIPHQGTLVISSLLLSLFLLFCAGFAYLRYRRFWPHVSKRSVNTGRARQTNHSNHHPRGYLNSVAHWLKSFFPQFMPQSGKTSRAVPRDAQGGLILTDERRNPAPSHNTYGRGTEEGQNNPRGQNTLYELEGSAQVKRNYVPRQNERHNSEHRRPQPVSPVRQGRPEADESVAGGVHDGPKPADIGSKTPTKPPSSNYNTRTTRGNPPSPVRMRPPPLQRQKPDTLSETTAAPKMQGRSGKQRRRDRPDGISPLSHAPPAKSRKMGMQAARESLQDVARSYGYSDTVHPRQA